MRRWGPVRCKYRPNGSLGSGIPEIAGRTLRCPIEHSAILSNTSLYDALHTTHIHIRVSHMSNYEQYYCRRAPTKDRKLDESKPVFGFILVSDLW